MQKHHALQVENLTVHYEDAPVLWDINLEVPEQKFVGIIGPNGAGKSTFMKAVLGLVKPVSGHIHFSGKTLKKMKGKIAYIPQRETIDWSFPITVRELVLMGRYPQRGMFRFLQKEDYIALESCLKEVGLEEFAHREIGKLSGGQQQRAFLARALLQKADIYFLDEPLSGVDHVSEKLIIQVLQRLKETGKTIFMIHHDLNSVEEYFDWIILLNVRLIGAGPTEKICTSSLLKEAYGKSFMLYDETMKRAKERTQGKL